MLSPHKHDYDHDFFLTVSKITLLCHLESSFNPTWRTLPLLVKILHKSRLRYYGKHGLKIDYPYQVRSELMLCSYIEVPCFVSVSSNNFMHVVQAYFEVADQSGIMSLVLWNELCPEFYQKLNVGTVMYLQNYTLKQSYSNRSHPQMDHHRMKSFSSGMYTLNISWMILYFTCSVLCKATSNLI